LGRALLIPDPLRPGNHTGLAPQAPSTFAPTSCLDVAAVAADRRALSAYSPAP